MNYTDRLDYFLRYISEKDDYVYSHDIYSELKDTHSAKELNLIVDKLSDDKYINVKIDESTNANKIYSPYYCRITYHGLQFLERGGYKSENERYRRNKIKTISKIAISTLNAIVIIIIAALGVYTSYSSNNRQIEMHKNEMQPMFKISFTPFKIQSKEIFDTESFEIDNQGHPIKNFTHTVSTYYKLEYLAQHNSQTYYVPINDFYGVHFVSTNLSGKLVEGYSLGNNADFFRVYKQCMEQTKNEIYYSIERFSLFKITYEDINNEKQTVYFKNNTEIDSKQYNEIIHQSKQIYDSIFLNAHDASLDKIKSLSNIK